MPSFSQRGFNGVPLKLTRFCGAKMSSIVSCLFCATIDGASSKMIPTKKRIPFRTNICLLKELTSLGWRRHSFNQRRDYGEQQRCRQRDTREDSEGARQDLGSSAFK